MNEIAGITPQAQFEQIGKPLGLQPVGQGQQVARQPGLIMGGRGRLRERARQALQKFPATGGIRRLGEFGQGAKAFRGQRRALLGLLERGFVQFQQGFRRRPGEHDGRLAGQRGRLVTPDAHEHLPQIGEATGRQLKQQPFRRQGVWPFQRAGQGQVMEPLGFHARTGEAVPARGIGISPYRPFQNERVVEMRAGCGNEGFHGLLSVAKMADCTPLGRPASRWPRGAALPCRRRTEMMPLPPMSSPELPP